MKLWQILVAVIAAIALLAGAYAFGRSDGSAIERDAQAKVDAATSKLREERQQLVDQLAGAAAAQETKAFGQMRELVRESHTIVERPVYRNLCVDADGVRILDAAAALANGDDPGEPAAGAGAPSAADPQR